MMSVYGFNYDDAYNDIEKMVGAPCECSLERLSLDQLRVKIKRFGLNFNRYLAGGEKLGTKNAASAVWAGLMDEIAFEEESAREEQEENATYYSMFIPAVDYATKASYENTYESYDSDFALGAY